MSSPQAFKTVDVLALEVKRDPVGSELVNLIRNPDGWQGGYGWITPVEGSVLIGVRNEAGTVSSLKYVTGTTTAPASNYFYSEQMAMTAGHWLRGRWVCDAAPYGSHRVIAYFYNAARTFLSQTIIQTANIGQYTTAAVQAPANTAYVAIGYEVGNTGGTYPYTKGGSEFIIRRVRWITKPTQAEADAVDMSTVADGYWTNILGTSHELRIRREALNLGTLTATVLDSTIDPATATLLRPGREVRVRANSGGLWSDIFVGELDDPNTTYELIRKKAADPKHARITITATDRTKALAGVSRPQGVPRIADLPWVLEGAGVPWVIDGNSNQVASANVASTNDNATALDQVALTRDTARGYAWVNRGGVLYASSSLPDPDVELIPNGTFPANVNGWTFWWVNAAAGTVTRSTAVTASDGVAGVMRVVVNAGTTQFRAALAPRAAVTPGAAYRFKADVRAAVTGRVCPVYVDWWDADGNYISTSGDDFSIGQTSSVAGAWTTITKDVVAPPGAVAAEPVVCIGTAVAGSPTMAANETHYIDGVSFKATAAVKVVDEAVYSSALDLGFAMGSCINSIDYKWLVANTYTGATDQYVLTGYEDAPSITQWGRRHKTFTIHGSGANAAAHAADVFARNAQPVVRPSSDVKFRAFKTTADVAAHAFTELYDLHRFVNTAKGVNQKVRVTSIEHTIKDDRWILAVGYEAPTAVAPPQVLPPVQTGTPTGPPFIEAVYTPATAAVGAAWVSLNAFTVVESSGITNGGTGAFTITRPGRYRVKATLIYDASGAAGVVRGGRLAINGTPLPYQTSPGYGGAAFASVEVDHTKRLAAGDVVSLEAYAGATVNILGGTAGYGQTRIEMQFLTD